MNDIAIKHDNGVMKIRLTLREVKLLIHAYKKTADGDLHWIDAVMALATQRTAFSLAPPSAGALLLARWELENFARCYGVELQQDSILCGLEDAELRLSGQWPRGETER